MGIMRTGQVLAVLLLIASCCQREKGLLHRNRAVSITSGLNTAVLTQQIPPRFSIVSISFPFFPFLFIFFRLFHFLPFAVGMCTAISMDCSTKEAAQELPFSGLVSTGSQQEFCHGMLHPDGPNQHLYIKTEHYKKS